MAESIGTILGIYPMKCGECDFRFHGRIWSLVHLIYSNCPRCHKTDLAKWSDHHYHAPLSLQIKLALGARRRRCVYCRYNFASWRPLKERFDAQKRIDRSQVRVQVGQDPLGQQQDDRAAATASATMETQKARTE